MTSRVIVLIDMDCFYCQVESRENPDLKEKPMAVVQYNTWKGGGIIAVNYEARAFGVKRGFRGDDAKAKCPDIALVSVPVVREKADLTKYRDAGKEVIQVLVSFQSAIVERASIDEAYIDITDIVDKKQTEMLSASTIDLERDLPNTFVVCDDDSKDKKAALATWFSTITKETRSDDIRLTIGATVVEEMRARVFEKTGFRCSAGIAHNKMLAKLACGINKPNKQTILPHSRVSKLFQTLPVGKLRGLGGKLGDAIVDELDCQTIGDVAALSLIDLKKKFDEKTSQWLFNIAKGFDHDPVKVRELPKSIGCSKNFLGPKMLDTREKVQHWFGQLAQEVCERLEKDREANGRVARGITVSITQEDGAHVSRAGPLSGCDPEQMARQAMTLIGNINESTQDSLLWRPKLKNLSISATKFQEETNGKAQKSIQNFFTGKKKEDEEESSPATSSKSLDIKRNTMVQMDNFDYLKCDKCKKMISPFEMPEHLDFHVAQELQAQFRQEQSVQNPVRTQHNDASVVQTKKRKKDVQASDSKRQRDIKSFFTKS